MQELETVRHHAVDVEDRGARHKDLSAVADVANSRRRVHRVADVAASRSGRLARVEAHADPDLGAAGPVVRGERALRRRGRRDRVPRLAKDAEERVALGVASIPPAAANVSRRSLWCAASTSP